MNCNKEEHNDYISGCVFCEIEDSGKRERERIIKLLEQDADNNYYALQLIKGEQK